MKLLVFVDIHGSPSALKRIEAIAKKENPDALICAGDITIFEQHIEQILAKLDSIGASINKPVFIVHGNHESEEVMQVMCKRLKNVVFVHKKIIELGEYAVSGFGGGGFSLVDHDFEIWAKSVAAELRGKKLIFLSHAPPYGTSLDLIYEEHAGSKSLVRFIKQAGPAVVVCGHLHENAGRKDKLGKTLIVNPGAAGAIVELK